MIERHIRRSFQELVHRCADDFSESAMKYRTNFCGLVYDVAKDLYVNRSAERGEEGLDTALRGQLFTLFAQWSGIENPAHRFQQPKSSYVVRPTRQNSPCTLHGRSSSGLQRF